MPKQSYLSRMCTSTYENFISNEGGSAPKESRSKGLVESICNFVSGFNSLNLVVSFETFTETARRVGGPIDPEEMFDWLWVNVRNSPYYMNPSDRSFRPYNAAQSIEDAWAESYPPFPHTRNGKVYDKADASYGMISRDGAQITVPDYEWTTERAPFYRLTSDKSTLVAGDTITYTIVSPPPRPYDIVYIEDEGQSGVIAFVDDKTQFTIDLRNQTTIVRQVKSSFYSSVTSRLILFTSGFGDVNGDREAGNSVDINPEPTTSTSTTTTTTASDSGGGTTTTTTTATASGTTTTTTAALISGTTTTTTSGPDTVIWGGNKSHKAVFNNNTSVVRLNIPNVPVYGDLLLTMPNGQVFTVPRYRITTTTTTTSSARYALNANGTTFTEGDTVTFTLSVIDVPAGTIVYYTITGISNDDIEQVT